MANRRHGGANRSFSGSSMSNPWQGGAPPVGGISQLTDTQAQLALALTNLLRPPSLGSSQQLPSLLNLPRLGGPGVPYQQFDRRNRSNIGRGNRFDKNNPNRQRQQNQQKNEGQKKSDDNSEIRAENQSEDAKKRDWKDEKSSTENGNEETKTANGVAANKEGETPEDATKKAGRYLGIPQSYLKCAICEKSMWDGESFEKHLRGRAHQQMCDSLDESFRIQADMMRQCIRLAEERKAIEMNRQKRHGKRVDLHKLSHCNMCNFDFYGREAEHRRSEGHQKLKRFLHPRCKRCRVEFSTKIEWEEHRLTPDHINKIIEMKDQTDSASVDLDLHDGVMDLNIDVEEYEADDIQPDHVIIDYTPETDLSTDFENRIPCYKKARFVGESLVTPITGFMCKICNRFFATDAKMQAHGKTRNHYDNFVKLLRTKHNEKIRAEKEKNKKHELEKEAEEGDDESCKRMKIDGENDEIPKEDLYDPMEAEEDDEKVKVENLDDDNKLDAEPTLEGIAAEEALLNEIDEPATVLVKNEEPVANTRSTRRGTLAVATPVKATPTRRGRK